ncbi:hypothetical protein [Sinimarinibacterium flocculans]|uniref:hypothetical protein n=1 Tax=Sinimarinibacterium flocculans TaxID=985250 RepID=UPI0024920EE4|nr:hypothetical protein [Sinimarinibacterium flocculans]
MIIPSSRHPHAEQIRRIARLSWWLLKNPNVPVENVYISVGTSKYSNPNSTKAEAARVMRELKKNGRVDKEVTDTDYATFSLKQEIPGTEVEGRSTGGFGKLVYEWVAQRDQVCEAKVVGTREKVIPAQPAREATEEQVVEEDIVEWDCPTLLEVEVPE